MVRSTIRLFAGAVIFTLITMRVSAIDAQEAASQQTVAETKPAAQEMPWLVPQRDYRGNLWNRSTLTGDWGGLRQKLMDNGVRFDFGLTQTIQGNAAGGKKDEFTYAARGVFGVKIDTGHAGLWPGGHAGHSRGRTIRAG
jgi:hypothetical protein